MKLYGLSAILIPVAIFFSSCETVEKEPTVPPVPELIKPLGGLEYADAVLCAEESTEWAEVDGGQVFVRGSRALAYFFPKTGKTSYVSAGAVKIDSIPLTAKADKTYLKQGFEYPAGYAYGPQVTWTVEGSPDFTGFVEPNSGFPSYPRLDSNIVDISQSQPFKLATLDKITNADSVLFAIRADDVEIVAKKDSTGSYYIFPVYDLKKLKKGSAQMEITAIRQRVVKRQNRTIVLLNQRMAKKKVTIF